MRCLFCKEASYHTKGIEHIIPESFGSKKLVLPKGLVCDKCNNYFARKVERPVMSHPSMRNVRGWYQVPNKKGKVPSVLGHIVGTEIQINMKRDKNKVLQVKAEKASEQKIVDKYLSDMKTTGESPSFLFSIDIDPPKKEMSRFLAMLALEALALRFSYGNSEERIIDEESYDLIRDFARYGKGVEEWPYHRQVLYPMDTLMKHPDTAEWVQVGFGHDIILTPYPETYVSFNLYGVQFTINVGGPSIHGYEVWLEDNDPLERTGNKLVKRIVNGQEKFYLEGDFCMKKGVEYDRNNWLGE